VTKPRAAQTFQTMNGLRGLACLMVVMFHQPAWFGALSPAKGFLGVDLFYVLSGFVIAHSYERRIEAGLPFGRFFAIRFIRLYPLYLLGVAISLLLIFTQYRLDGTIPDKDRHALLWLPAAVTMGPALDLTNMNAELYPLNSPAWSLFFELAVNLVYAATWPRWSVRNLLILVAITGGIMLSRPDFYGEGGWNVGSLPLGLVRVFFGFPMGVMIYRLKDRIRWPTPRIHSLVLLASFPVLLMLPSLWADQVCVLIGFPLLVACAARSEPDARLAPIFALLGGASYAIYAIHIPLSEFTKAMLARTGNVFPAPVTGLIFLAILLPLCLLLDRYFDTPLRRRLNRWFAPPKQPPSG
jgi:peptidoglycan/LPS O-acetylase OafA/YrhL